MYLTESVLAPIEQAYGIPWRAVAEADFAAREFALLEHCARKERAHDVTLLIRDEGGRLAVIRKPSYPEDVFRPPSGGVEPGEAFVAGALREAREEVGLEIELERFLLRVEARFRLAEPRQAERFAPWSTLVFLARAASGGPVLIPEDTVEICEARWATVEEMCGPLRAAMLRMGSAGMRYRVDLQDLALAALGHGTWRDEPGRVIRLVGGC